MRGIVSLSFKQWATWNSGLTDIWISSSWIVCIFKRGSTSMVRLHGNVSTASPSLCSSLSMCLCAPPQGSGSLSIRIKGLRKRRSLSRVSTDPLIWNAKYVREWEAPRQCTSVPVRATDTFWPMCRMATLFALLRLCGWIIKMQKAPGACVCAKVCVGALVFHCPEQSVATQIPWCLCYQIGGISPSLAACWCPVQTAPRTSQLRFRSGNAFIPFYLFILECSFRFQPSTTYAEWREQLFWSEEHKGRKSRCIWMHQGMHARACLGSKCHTSRQFV